MKKLVFLLGLLFFLFSQISTAQDMDLMDWDFDTLFDEPWFDEIWEDESQIDLNPISVISSIRQRGITVSASYNFRGAVNPGWDYYPWELDGNEHFSWVIGFSMSSNIGITAQISEVFRVRSVLNVSIPGPRSGSDSIFVLKDMFFDYNFHDRVFLRAGKYEQSWGLNNNFNFTNLLSRLAIYDSDKVDFPARGPSYLMKFDMPIGVGGIQLLALTRVRIVESGVTPSRDNIGFGGKYNLALRWVDFDIGVFRQRFMATRGFLSIKTTIRNTELYNEWLVVNNDHTDNSMRYAFNIGVVQQFFGDKLEINAEYFYNGEGSTEYFNPETEFRVEGISPFLNEHNIAFNVLYRFGGDYNLRFFTRFLYASKNREGASEESIRLIPGVRLNPFPNVEFYIALPMALGSKEGHYYTTNALDKFGESRPICLAFIITFSGSVQAAYRYQ
jgi:hypothetical protein